MYLYFQIAILLVIGGAQIIKRSFLVKYIKLAYWSAIFLVFVYSAYLTYSQYVFWKGEVLAKFLLPPVNSPLYFAGYSLWKFWSANVIALVASLIFIFLAGKINKKLGERFFERDELTIGATAIFIVGYPGVLIYAIVLLASFLVINGIITAIRGIGHRTSLYYIWIPAAIFATLIVELWISHLSGWNLLVI